MGQTTDFKEGTRRLEWNLKKASFKKDLVSSLLLFPSLGLHSTYAHLFEDDDMQSCDSEFIN